MVLLPFTPDSHLTNKLIKTLIFSAAHINSRIPFQLKRKVALAIIQHIFKQSASEEEIDFLDGRILKIQINDIGENIYLSSCNNKMVLLESAKEDTSIKGNLKEFIELALLQKDPDSLFFQRRLLIEGDTDLGLAFKNSLEALEYTLPTPIQKAMMVIHKHL